MKVDLRDQGTILFPSAEHLSSPCLKGATLPAPLVELEPALAVLNQPAFYLRERSVDPRALTAAALQAAKRRGVDISSGEEVTAINLSDGRVAGVITTKTSFHAPKVVNCAGAWSGQIAPYAFPTRPVKGQMLCLLSPSRNLLEHVIRAPGVYLIPRSDGRILVGATVEEAGFDKRTRRRDDSAPAPRRDRHRPRTAQCEDPRRLGRPASRNSRRIAHSRPDGDSRLLRSHRPFSRRNPSCPNHGASHGGSNYWNRLQLRPYAVLTSKVFHLEKLASGQLFYRAKRSAAQFLPVY